MTVQHVIERVKQQNSLVNCLEQDEKIIILDALEKQIPKKTEAEEDVVAECANEVCLMCPTCGSFIGYAIDCEDEEYQVDYCSACGQKLDWSE